MNFFERQTHARASSRRLVLLFVLAVALLLVAVSVVGEAIWKLTTGGLALPPYFLVTNAFVVLLFVVGGAWLESLRLADGGAALAHRLGARSLDPYDARHRRLAHVVDELVIAAGIPVPEVFVLQEPGINALTAGDEPTRCAIVVTQGALEQLTRDELQGVVAHEIAHVVHGDVALNTRAAGAVYGLMSLSIMGRSMLAAAVPRRQAHGKTSLIPWPGFWLAGAALVALGWLGWLAGRLIQAGLSRQREFLADAHAVELTRNVRGLGGALRKIAGQRQRRLGSEYGDAITHLLLAAQGARHGWFDTHPALAQRIRRLYGRYMPPIEVAPLEPTRSVPTPRHAASALAPLDFSLDEDRPDTTSRPAATDGVAPTLKSLAFVGGVRSAAGHAGVLLTAARCLSPSFESARRLLCGLVVATDRDGEHADHDLAVAPDVARPDDELAAALAWLSTPDAAWLRLPLLEVLAGRLRPWPRERREELLAACRETAQADGRLDRTEWIYLTLAQHRLLPAQPGPEPGSDALRRALAEVFGVAAAIGGPSARRTREIVSHAAEQLGIAPPVSTSDGTDATALGEALEALAAIAPLTKPGLLRSLETLAREPGTPQYQAFLAAVAAAIDCPPLRPRGSVHYGIDDNSPAASDAADDTPPPGGARDSE